MTPDELAAIRERAEKATPGPWEARRENSQFQVPGRHFMLSNNGTIAEVLDADYRIKQNADFIAAARSDIPALLVALEERAGQLREAQRLVEDLREALEEYTLESPVLKKRLSWE